MLQPPQTVLVVLVVVELLSRNAPATLNAPLHELISAICSSDLLEGDCQKLEIAHELGKHPIMHKSLGHTYV